MSKGVTWTPEQLAEHEQKFVRQRKLKDNGSDIVRHPPAIRLELLKDVTVMHKYRNVPVMHKGLRFDSKIERDRYLWWIARPECVHVDVHPKVLLDPEAGIFYRPDLCVWRVGRFPLVHYEDTKSPQTMKLSSFRDKRKQFDAHHPATPLWVVLRGKNGSWIVKRNDMEDEVQI